MAEHLKFWLAREVVHFGEGVAILVAVLVVMTLFEWRKNR